MDSHQLADYQYIFNLSTPSPLTVWRQRRALEALVTDGSSEAILLLLAVATAEHYRIEVRQLSGEVLRQTPQLHLRALYFYFSRNWQEYESLDFERSLLHVAYQMGSKALRAAIVEIARESGRSDLLETLRHTRPSARLAEMSVTEWELTLSLLRQQQDWEKLWQLAQLASPVRSLEIMCLFNNSQWQPSEPNQAQFFVQLRDLAGFIPGESSHIYHVAINPDGHIIATCRGMKDLLIQLFDMQGHSLLERTLPSLDWHNRGWDRLFMTFSANNQYFILAYNNIVEWWHLPDVRLVYTFSEQNLLPYHFRISGDGSFLLTVHNSITRLWDTSLVQIYYQAVEQSSLEDLQWLAQAKDKLELSVAAQHDLENSHLESEVDEAAKSTYIAVQRARLEFTHLLLAQRWRYEIEVTDSATHHAIHEFDVEFEDL
jgi:hypothetical protein